MSEPVSRTFVVTNRHGLHVRPCLAIVQTAARFQATVTILKKDGPTANAASILELISLAATQGTELIVTASGSQAELVLDALGGLFASEFESVYK